MKTKRTFLISMILIGIVFAQGCDAVIEQGYSILEDYINLGEQIDMKPREPVYLGPDPYCVLEVKSMGEIRAMFPIDSEENRIDVQVGVKEVMRIHYLANFFAKDDSIKNFLMGTRTFAQGTQDELSTKLSNFESNVEPFINVSLPTKEPYKNAVRDAISDAEDLRSQINFMLSKIEDIQMSSDITIADSGFDSMFSKENSFLDSLEDVLSTSNDLHAEANQLVADGELDTGVRDSILVYSTYAGLSSLIIRREDDLSTNQNEINGFFNGLDAKTDDYYIRLNNRLEGGIDKIKIEEILAELANYTSEYKNMTEKKEEKRVPNNYNNVGQNLEEVYNLLDECYEYCAGWVLSECNSATEKYDDIESLITTLNADIDGYTTAQCTSGQTRSCTTDAGESGTQTCVNSQWGACEAGGGFALNWPLVIGLAMILVLLLLFKFKGKFLPSPEKEENAPGMWEKYDY